MDTATDIDLDFTTEAGVDIFAQLSLSKEHGHSMSICVGSAHTCAHTELTPKEARQLGEWLDTVAGIIIGSRRAMKARKMP